MRLQLQAIRLCMTWYRIRKHGVRQYASTVIHFRESTLFTSSRRMRSIRNLSDTSQTQKNKSAHFPWPIGQIFLKLFVRTSKCLHRMAWGWISSTSAQVQTTSKSWSQIRTNRDYRCMCSMRNTSDTSETHKNKSAHFPGPSVSFFFIFRFASASVFIARPEVELEHEGTSTRNQ